MVARGLSTDWPCRDHVGMSPARDRTLCFLDDTPTVPSVSLHRLSSNLRRDSWHGHCERLGRTA